MWLIVGLGNPGTKYAKNRHNAGFMAVDFILSTHSFTDESKKDFKGELYKSKNIYLLKPNTYMNLSGDSVEVVKNYYKIDNVIVIHDEIELSPGALRFKKGGGHAGHNGLRSIDSKIGSDYFRVRVGIGKPEHKTQVADYCLNDFSKAESETMKESIANAANAALELTSSSLADIQSKYTVNKK